MKNKCLLLFLLYFSFWGQAPAQETLFSEAAITQGARGAAAELFRLTFLLTHFCTPGEDYQILHATIHEGVLTLTIDHHLSDDVVFPPEHITGIDVFKGVCYDVLSLLLFEGRGMNLFKLCKFKFVIFKVAFIDKHLAIREKKLRVHVPRLLKSGDPFSKEDFLKRVY